jgi:hypothetical protein
MSGAVDFNECPSRYSRLCRCGPCAICGYQKHMGIHGPLFGQPAGSLPYGHEYVPENIHQHPKYSPGYVERGQAKYVKRWGG